MEQSNVTYYRIGDLVFEVASDLPFSMEFGSAKSFIVEPSVPDYRYVIYKGDSISSFTGKLTLKNSERNFLEFVNERGEYLRGFDCGAQLYDAALKLEKDGGKVMYLSQELLVERFKNKYDPTSFLALEHVMLERGGFFLHSSHVNVGGRALVFSAPSGTGKSTQADLWEKHAGGEVMNGDRTLLRKKDGVWHAYGCPMCGTSGIYKQGDEPIHAIVMLSQGKENTVRRLSAGEAFQRIYPEITVPRWNRELVLRAMELLDDVMAQVPIYALSCTPDERAVEALREAIGL